VYSRCNISQMKCDGVVVPANIPRNSYNNCSIYSVLCNGSIIPFNSSCVPDQMTCNGQAENYGTYSGPLSQCNVSKLFCKSQENCSSVYLECSRSPKCTISSTTPCNLQCNQPMNLSSCVCPDDYMGTRCATLRPYSCSTSLAYPPPQCLPTAIPDPNDYLLSGDRKCTVFDDPKANASLGYRMQCKFDNTPGLNTTNNEKYNFTYWAKGDNISLTLPVNWTGRHKIYDFNKFSDTSQVRTTDFLTAFEVAGSEFIWFNFSLDSVPDNFWFARRLYYELSVNTSSSGVTAQGFVDSVNRPIAPAVLHLSTFTIVLIVGSAVLFLLVVGFISYKLYFFSRKEENKPEKSI